MPIGYVPAIVSPSPVKHAFAPVHLKENLRQPKVSEFLGGFTATDAPLLAAQSLKQAFHLQIVLRQTGDSITIQQLFLVYPPTLTQARPYQTLGSLCPGIGLKRLDQRFHVPGDLSTAGGRDIRRAMRG